jgi:hypothetical protein
MPKNISKTSSQADETSSAPSVLDFLYHDSRRIGSFLAQFEGDGHLQQLTRTKDGKKGKNETSFLEAKGNIGVASGKINSETETSIETNEGYSRVFDPLWANARAFMDHLSEHNMLHRDLSETTIGQFVLVTGYLSIQDLGMFKNAWALPGVQRQIKAGASGSMAPQMSAREKAAAREQENNTTAFLEMIQIMPHAVHAQLITSEEKNNKMIWCTLNQEYLISPPSDITLAYGGDMAGEWTIMGVLSAYPEYTNLELDRKIEAESFGITDSLVGQISKVLIPIVRLALGRPSAAYAITPLLIFREVT